MSNSDLDSFIAKAGLGGTPNSVSTRVEVDFLIGQLRLESGQQLLDLPCGNGRHAQLFAERGVYVTAVDADFETLALAKSFCAHSKVQYHQADARSIAELGLKFDAISSPFSCIGYFEDSDQDELFLRAIISTLKPGFRMVLSTANGTVVRRMGDTHTVSEPSEFRIERFDRYDARSKCLDRRFLILNKNSGQTTEIGHRRRLYSSEELTDLLRRNGCSVIQVFADYGGGAFDADESAHAIYVSERKS